MKPVERGLLLENEQEKALALNTLTTAIVPVDEALVPERDVSSMAELGEILRASDQPSILLGHGQKKVLNDAVRVAKDNFLYSMGIASCYGIMTGLDFKKSLESMKESDIDVFKKAQLAAHCGFAAIELSSLIELYGKE